MFVAADRREIYGQIIQKSITYKHLIAKYFNRESVTILIQIKSYQKRMLI